MAVKAAQEYRLDSIKDFRNILRFSSVSLLRRQVVPVLALKVVDVHFFDNFEAFLHAVLGDKLVNAFEFVVDHGCRARRVILVIPFVRRPRPDVDHDQLGCKDRQHHQHVGEMADQKPCHDEHDAIRDQRSQRLGVNDLRNCTDMERKALIQMREQVIDQQIQENDKPVSLSEELL